MSHFDQEPEGQIHGECEVVITRLESEVKALQRDNLSFEAAIEADGRRIAELERELKAFDPDPVVCGCHEALCPHTPIAKLPRQALVDHFKAHIKSLNEQIEKSERDLQAAMGDAKRYRYERRREWLDYEATMRPIGGLTEEKFNGIYDNQIDDAAMETTKS